MVKSDQDICNFKLFAYFACGWNCQYVYLEKAEYKLPIPKGIAFEMLLLDEFL